MKKILLTCILATIVVFTVDAQRTAVKLGVGGLFVTQGNLRFEQALGDRLSFQLTGSFKIPNNFSVDAATDAPISAGRLTGWGILPELRFYLGKDKAGTIEGFYLAPFIRYYRYNLSADQMVNYNTGTEFVELDIDADYSYSSIGGGLQLGYHWILGKHFSLDWHFLGFSGDYNTFGIRYDLSNSEYDLIDVAEQALNELNEGTDVAPIELDDLGEIIDGNRVRFRFPFPFVGFRTGISIGYAF